MYHGACDAMNNKFSDFTDEELLAFEEQLYDDEVSGDPTAWATRDEILWEMNRRWTTGLRDDWPE